MVINPAIECYLLDLDGRVVRYSGGEDDLALERVRVEPIQRFLEGSGGRPVRGDDPRSPGKTRLFSAAPIMVGQSYTGYLYVILGGQEYANASQLVAGNYALRMGVFAAIGCVLFALVAGVILFRVLTRRIRRLSGALAAFEAGGFRQPPAELHRSSAPPRDEIDQLSLRFRRMAERIIAQVEELENTDALRRELVANVSHDLRTPLASLKGYLETLSLKESTLTTDERRRYLDVAIRHADRLARLVEDLFELAKLDARRESPALEPFALDELVMDLLAKFELNAERRAVRLEAKLAGPLPHARAEIGLIERALENLIDNALRHTPQGGRVTVQLEPQGPDVLVHVENDGPPIPDEALPRLFDPFYRVDVRDAEDEPRGAGLGLAIVKRILELHGRSIEVASELERGTVFTFRLSAA
jgi:signal transduction histidine kinase